MTEKIDKVKQDNRTRAQKAKDLHEANTQKRADELATLKGFYLAEVDNPVLLDILNKIEAFKAVHLKVAQDGVGSRKTGEKYENGSDVFDLIYLTPAQRAAHLDKAAGLQEIADYIGRMIALPDTAVKTEA